MEKFVTENKLEGKKQTSKETAEGLMEKGKVWRGQLSKMLSYRCKISVDTEGWKFAVLTQCSQQKGVIQDQENKQSVSQAVALDILSTF